MSLRKAYFGGGCFWGVEALFDSLDGVEKAVSGYMGGHVSNPAYEQVCSGKTGHAEVVEVAYDPAKVAYEELLDYFFRMHDPTTPDRQGLDIGSQYRSVIFTANEEQKRQARAFIETLEERRAFDGKIVTEIAEADAFWPAEEYHQDYYAKKYGGGSGPFCHRLRPESFLEAYREQNRKEL